MEKAIRRYWPIFVLPTFLAFILGFIALFFKKFDVGKEISELVMLAGYVYMLVFIVQLIEVLMTSLRTIFML